MIKLWLIDLFVLILRAALFVGFVPSKEKGEEIRELIHRWPEKRVQYSGIKRG